MEATELHNTLSIATGLITFIALMISLYSNIKRNNHLNIVGALLFILGNIIQVANYDNFFRLTGIIFIILFIMIIIMNIEIIQNREE